MEEIRYASVIYYRVVVSHDSDRPNVYYVDMCRDGFCSHDIMFKMQKKFYRNDKLERVFNDSNGIKLKEARDGKVSLIYTKHRDVMAAKHQQELRQKIDPEIMRVFKKMKEDNRLMTISVPLQDSVIVDEMKRVLGAHFKVDSLQAEKLKTQYERQKRLEQLKAVRQAYYAQQKYASAPHLKLMIQQMKYSGD